MTHNINHLLCFINKYLFIQLANGPQITKIWINLFHTTGLFFYLHKSPKKQKFSDVFTGYRKRLVALDGLNSFRLYLRLEFLNLR